jgi:hypothetical protein
MEVALRATSNQNDLNGPARRGRDQCRRLGRPSADSGGASAGSAPEQKARGQPPRPQSPPRTPDTSRRLEPIGVAQPSMAASAAWPESGHRNAPSRSPWHTSRNTVSPIDAPRTACATPGSNAAGMRYPRSRRSVSSHTACPAAPHFHLRLAQHRRDRAAVSRDDRQGHYHQGAQYLAYNWGRDAPHRMCTGFPFYVFSYLQVLFRRYAYATSCVRCRPDARATTRTHLRALSALALSKAEC